MTCVCSCALAAGGSCVTLTSSLPRKDHVNGDPSKIIMLLVKDTTLKMQNTVREQQLILASACVVVSIPVVL